MGNHGHDGHESHHHVIPLKVYFQVFGALMFLTVVTVGVSFAGLPPNLSIAAALVVAVIKATIVAAYFMHLKWDDKINTVVLVGSCVFLFLFFAFTLLDIDTRGTLMAEQSNHHYWDEENQAAELEATPLPEVPLAPELKLPGEK